MRGAPEKRELRRELQKAEQNSASYFYISLFQSDRFMLMSPCGFQRRPSLVLRLPPSTNGHQGAEPSARISPPFLSILQSGRPVLQGLCNFQRSASLVLRLRPSANGHQGGGAIHSTILSHHGKPTGNTKKGIRINTYPNPSPYLIT